MSNSTSSNATHMRQEIEQIPEVTRRLLTDGAAQMEAAGRALAMKQPALVVTIARGSSDHAAAFLKYAIELVRATRARDRTWAAPGANCD